jgi:hypothetical protein
MSRRWTAKCWMGSNSGYVDLQVSASTFAGAREQLERIYGAEQIINLHEIRSNSSSSSSDSGGILGLAVLIGAGYLLFNYWPIFVGIVALYLIFSIFK